MSVEAMTWAFGATVESGSTAKLVLLGIANHARRDGTGAWPAVETLATYASCDVRTVQRALRRLRDERLIEATGRGPRGTVEYRLAGMTDASEGVTDRRGDLPQEGEADRRGDRLPGRHSGPKGVTPVSPEPSLTVLSASSLRSEAETAREPDFEIELDAEKPDGLDLDATIDPPTLRWRGRAVPRQQTETAYEILDAFNQAAGTGYRPLDGQGRPSQNLSRILGALAADDRIDLPVAGRMIEIAFARPFWEGSPQTGVVFGPGVREGLVEQALNPGTAIAPPAGRGGRDTEQARMDRLKAMHAKFAEEEAAEAVAATRGSTPPTDHPRLESVA